MYSRLNTPPQIFLNNRLCDVLAQMDMKMLEYYGLWSNDVINEEMQK